MRPILALLTAALLGSATFLSAQEPAKAADASAARSFQAQTVCPISGKPISKEIFVDYEGQRVYFCCKGCPPKFQQFPDGYLFTMYQKGMAPENVQKTCPLSGQPLESREHFVQVGNKRVYVCCPKCLKKAKADPVALLDKLEGRKKQTECPVMGGEIDPEVSSVVQGQKVHYCCEGCDKKMKADPDKYFTALARKGMVTEPAERVCPLSGEEVKPGSGFPITWKGRRLWFCCEKCVAKFVKDPAKVLATL